MKKLIITAVCTAAILPNLIQGIQSEREHKQDQREAMLEQCFISWCGANGYDYWSMQRSEREAIAADVWSESDEYQEAQDSIDRVLRDRVINYMLDK